MADQIPMSAAPHVRGYGDGHSTEHHGPNSGFSGPYARVIHNPGADYGSHQVHLFDPRGAFGVYFTHPSSQHPDSAYWQSPTDRGHAPPPSDALRTLIEAHHTDPQLAPLLDALVEHVPALTQPVLDHFLRNRQS